MKINDQNISIDKLSSWGLLSKIKREMIIDYYISDINEPTKEEIDNLRRDWLNNMQIKNEVEFEKWKKINHFTLNKFDLYLIRGWKWQRWCLKNFKEVIHSYYLKRKEELDEFTFLIIRVNQENLAEELYLRIKENENSFSELSEKFSNGEEKYSRGKLGPLKRKAIHPELAKFLIKSNLGELNYPIKIEKTYFILKLIDKVSRELDEKLKTDLSKELGDKLIVEKIKNIEL